MIVPCSQSEEYRQEYLDIENQLLGKKLIHEPVVQKLLGIADRTFNKRAYELAVSHLNLILKFNNTNERRMPDEFRPHCPEALSKAGTLHLINQMDGLPIFIDHNKFVTGLGIFGPQGSGKSCEIIELCSKIRQIDPNIRIILIDPKGAFSNLTSFLHIALAQTSFDLMPPSNVSLENFVYELMPILAQTTGLIYGLEPLNQAADIAIHQRQQYIQMTNTEPRICLKDIRESLNLLKISGFRKIGYHDAAATALSLILGKQNLFSCRKGVSLEWMFNQNVVVDARCVTDNMQCRFFITYLLYWLYQQSRYNPETNKIKRIVIVDDASRFVGTIGNLFDTNSKTSPLGHILAVLRSTGVCLIFATQLPGQVDPAVLSLTRNALVIGNINGQDNLGVIQGMMSLTDEQKAAITRFKTRETLAFISGSDWPLIHGWTPKVEIENFITSNPVKVALDTSPWHSLTEIPQQPVIEVTESSVSVNEAQEVKTTQADASRSPENLKVKSCTDKLVFDCIRNPFEKAGAHAVKMDSIREYDTAQTEALQYGFLIASQCGKAIYFIPTHKAYDKFSIINPYQRATSIEHAFFANMTAHYLKQSGLKVQTETPIGSKGATIDVTTIDKSGNMIAYEITLSTSNLSSNASKLQDTSYKKIIWLCRDADTAKAVIGYFNKSASLPPELTSKFEYVFFGKWIPQIEKEKKKWKRN
jgi:hypothetical protein